MNNIMHNSYNLSITVWNVRGAGTKDFLLTLKELINQHRPNILALMEMKISGQTANGQSDVTLHLLNSSHQQVTMSVTNRGEAPWIFTAFYGSPNESTRHNLWDKLNNFNSFNSARVLLLSIAPTGLSNSKYLSYPMKILRIVSLLTGKKVRMRSELDLKEPKKSLCKYRGIQKLLGGLGFRSIRDTNFAFLIKLGWRVLVEQDKLWFRIYVQTIVIIDVMWICPSKNIIFQLHGMEFLTMLGPLGVESILKLVMAIILYFGITLGCLVPLSLNSLCNDYDKGWKWEEFMELLPDEVCQRIASFVFSPGLNNRDCLIKEGSSSGKFSLISTINLLHATVHEAEDPLWNIVWKCPASQRMQFSFGSKH
ncbi:hypothetical protein Cgig2_016360 [Carnegiea gigantea]|uniref:Endonuclease/exonuclease/phosphatase domain-containing protein n=1 Tax=Carnegiea gigantea TaxID=171969 RepID=A0A9Q1Q8B9_9CARY|nr:hypothetical protein Cgig2_016360 [Carnegiea gigantea]